MLYTQLRRINQNNLLATSFGVLMLVSGVAASSPHRGLMAIAIKGQEIKLEIGDDVSYNMLQHEMGDGTIIEVSDNSIQLQLSDQGKSKTIRKAWIDNGNYKVERTHSKKYKDMQLRQIRKVLEKCDELDIESKARKIILRAFQMQNATITHIPGCCSSYNPTHASKDNKTCATCQKTWNSVAYLRYNGEEALAEIRKLILKSTRSKPVTQVTKGKEIAGRLARKEEAMTAGPRKPHFKTEKRKLQPPRKHVKRHRSKQPLARGENGAFQRWLCKACGYENGCLTKECLNPENECEAPKPF